MEVGTSVTAQTSYLCKRQLQALQPAQTLFGISPVLDSPHKPHSKIMSKLLKQDAQKYKPPSSSI